MGAPYIFFNAIAAGIVCINKQKAISISAKPVPGECTLDWYHAFGAMKVTDALPRF